MKMKFLPSYVICFQVLISYLNGQSDYKFLNKQNFKGYPEKLWYKYENIQDEGWDLNQLENAKSYFDSLASSAAFLVYNGGVVLNWGDVKKNICVIRFERVFCSL
jgi:hypothetical protein